MGSPKQVVIQMKHAPSKAFILKSPFWAYHYMFSTTKKWTLYEYQLTERTAKETMIYNRKIHVNINFPIVSSRAYSLWE